MSITLLCIPYIFPLKKLDTPAVYLELTQMAIYTISHVTGKTIAHQVLKAPAAAYAVRIKPHVPELLHPFVLWTETMPRHGAGILWVKGDSVKASVALFHNTGHIEYSSETAKVNVNLDGRFLAEAKDSSLMLDYLYRFGQNCVQRRYNVKALKDLEVPELR